MTIELVFEEFKSKIGTVIHQSEWIEISQDMINAFADATDDHQWIHIDTERAAKESPFKATIAHGYLSLIHISEPTRLGRARMPSSA